MKKSVKMLAILIALLLCFTAFAAGCRKNEDEYSSFFVYEEVVDSTNGNKETQSKDDAPSTDSNSSGDNQNTSNPTTSGNASSSDNQNTSNPTTSGNASSSGNQNTSKPTDSQNTSSKEDTITKKEYTIKAKGSEYADGIMLPKLSKKQAKISYMTNTDWDYIVSENAAFTTAIYHAMTVWKETYGVEVEIELTDWDNFTNYLITAVTSGEGPDVFRYIRHPSWINTNLVASLDDKMDLTDPDYDMNYINSNYKYNGHVYALVGKPSGMPNSLIVYNATKFRQAGEEDPLALYNAGKWTFTQFAKTAKALSDPANDEYGFTGYGLFPTSYPLVVLNADKTLTSHLNSSGYLKWLTPRIKLIREGGARTEDKGGSNYRTTFPTGKDAMIQTDGSDYLVILKAAKSNGIKDKFGVAPVPSNDMIGEKLPRGGGGDGTQGGTYLDAFAMSSQCKNQEGAIEFLRLVTKIATNITKSQGEFGAMTDVMSDAEKKAFRNIKYQDYTNITKGGLDGIGSLSESLRNTYLMPLYNSTNKQEVSAAISKMTGPLNSAIKEYEISIGIRK